MFCVNCVLQHDSNAIHVASHGKPEIVEMLIQAGCEVNARDEVMTYSYQMVCTLFFYYMFFVYLMNASYFYRETAPHYTMQQ